ncbi:hypothetical protein CDAR_508641 [Caerostris darwini]|uniref:Secreted protein n=1 Tax=Caerostris darwini TaxID=1538125 RepID=A0AAV4N224_9ARAC|nr:hypothetical protein CDAR_508641 [Caerostris darwini]
MFFLRNFMQYRLAFQIADSIFRISRGVGLLSLLQRTGCRKGEKRKKERSEEGENTTLLCFFHSSLFTANANGSITVHSCFSANVANGWEEESRNVPVLPSGRKTRTLPEI